MAAKGVFRAQGKTRGLVSSIGAVLALAAIVMACCPMAPRLALAAEDSQATSSQPSSARQVATSPHTPDATLLASQAQIQPEAPAQPITATPTEKPIVRKAQKIKLVQKEYCVAPGAQRFGLNAKAKTKLVYRSSNPSVAKVSSKGKVTVGKKSGTAIIYVRAAQSESYKAAKAKVRIKVVPYRKANGMVVHSGGGKPSHEGFFNMSWNFIIRCKDPNIANHAAVAARYIAQNGNFSYDSRFPKSQANVNARASIYKAIVKATGKNPTYKQLRKIRKVSTHASTSCTPTILSTYWLYYNMNTKIKLKWRSPYNKRAYWYYCGAPNVEYHQLEKAIRHVNKEYKRKGKIAPFQIIYIPKSKRSSFFSRSNISKNLKRGDIVAACPNPNANGHTVMMM